MEGRPVRGSLGEGGDAERDANFESRSSNLEGVMGAQVFVILTSSFEILASCGSPRLALALTPTLVGKMSSFAHFVRREGKKGR